MNLSTLLEAVQRLLNEPLPPSRELAVNASGLAGWEKFLTGNSDSTAIVKLLLLDTLKLTYGDESSDIQNPLSRLDHLGKLFLHCYGDGPVEILRAPARINIIGEHVDYVSYLPTASLTFGSREHDMMMLYRTQDSPQIQGVTTLTNCDPFSFDMIEGPSLKSGSNEEKQWISYLFSRPAPKPHWSNYVKGSVFFARLKHGAQIHRGYQFAVDSTIPPGGGASSSSALTVLAGSAIRGANHVAFDARTLALDSAQAEWYLGTRGGSLDHNAMCLSRRRSAVYLSYSDSTARLAPLPDEECRWVTFYSHSADKSREIMLEYNARAAVSRLLIPALLQSLVQERPDLATVWNEVSSLLQHGEDVAMEKLQLVLGCLPEEMTLKQVQEKYPETFRSCQEAFPALVEHRHETPLRIRDLALHHAGETLRVACALRLLTEGPDTQESSEPDQPLRQLGILLDQSHASLRDLYGVSTPTVERLMEIIRSDSSIYGARLMGGGFGGNILALVPRGSVSGLLERVQKEFFDPQQRKGMEERLVMVSTPGDGVSTIGPQRTLRTILTTYTTQWLESDRYRPAICRLLDLEIFGELEKIQPVIVVAGKGQRAKDSGLDVPKPLAPIFGVPVVVRILRILREACPQALPPILVVSPESEKTLREVLAGEELSFVVQSEPRGTANAVLAAADRLRGFHGRTLVLWGTQPVVRAATIRRTLHLTALFPEYKMIVPTALIDHPYAPLRRDETGQVLASRETHLEQAEKLSRGETNLGLYVLQTAPMVENLQKLHHLYWREPERRYHRPGGELGFPNEMITVLASQPCGVLAAPIADWREPQGIKSLDDVGLCEGYIRELNQARS
jgi:N-acetylgalactosamine kinase